MITKIAVVIAFALILAVVALGCSKGTAAPVSKPTTQSTTVPKSTPTPSGNTGGIIRPTWITPQVEGDLVSIPASEVDSGKLLHFKVKNQATTMAFMAYKFGGEIQVRADICPPCGSQSYNLVGDILVCNACGTKFRATTGAGVSGACVNYPKAEAPYSIAGDSLIISLADLITAYNDTIKAG